MTFDPKDIPWLDRTFFENQENFPQEELDKHAGKYVAYSWDGSKILASADDPEEVERLLIAAGIDPHRVVHGYVDPPDAVYI